MKTFTDNAGRTWTISVNVDSIKRVRDLLNVELLDLEHVYLRLLEDDILICDVAYCICKPQVDAQNISRADFDGAMWGEAIGHARKALLEEIENFSPDPKRREIRRLMREAHAKVTESAMEAVKIQLQGPALEQTINILQSEIGKSSTNSPESSESTLDH